MQPIFNITIPLVFVILFANTCTNTQRTFTETEHSKPNFLILFVDDLGSADLGYAQAQFHTPNIDSLKKSGLYFANARITTPTCSPSRATLLTGKSAADHEVIRHIPSYALDQGFTTNGEATTKYHYIDRDPAQVPSKNYLDTAEITYAEELTDLGYYNAFFGKWHLGHEPYHPIHQGFQEQHLVCNLGHPVSYYPPYFTRGVDHDTNQLYLTDSLTKSVQQFIASYDKSEPFQLSVYYYNVHSPFEGRKDWVQKYKAQGMPDTLANYAAMVAAVDESVGKILTALKEKGVLDHTFIIFLSDQGGYFENPPFSGGKNDRTLFEGGARVPMIVKYGSHYEPRIFEEAVCSNDIFPTMLDLAGNHKVEYQTFIESTSLIPLIERNAFPNRTLYGYRAYESQYASVIDGKWKLVAYRDGRTQLFNLSTDIKEENDLSESHPGTVKLLLDKLRYWEKNKEMETYSPFF